MIISVDFDGTLCDHKYPEIGTPHIDLINKIKLASEKGHKIILWTCRSGEKLAEAVEWCSRFGLYFNAVNDDLPEVKETFTFKSSKIYGDIYLDDRNKNINDFLKEDLK